MTPKTYMSLRARLTPYAWWLVIALALALGCWFAGRATVTQIRQDERTRVLAEGERVASAISAAERAHWQHAVDSLRAAASAVDTVLDTVFLRAKAESRAPIPPASDTTALLASVRSCRATLDTLASTCAAFRATATAALAAADTVQRRDSATIRGLSILLAGEQRNALVYKQQRDARPTTLKLVTTCSATGVFGAAVGFVVGVTR